MASYGLPWEATLGLVRVYLRRHLGAYIGYEIPKIYLKVTYWLLKS